METGRILSAVVLLAALAAASPAPAAAQAIQRSMHVSAVDSAGAPIPNLGPPDFIVREDKVSREVLRAGPATDPMQVVLLLDDGPTAEEYLTDYRAALKAFIETIGADANVNGKHSISIVTVAARPTIRTNYTADTAQLQKAAAGIFPQADSLPCMVDGIFEVSEGIVRRHSPRPIIVAITAGSSLDASNHSYVEVLEMLRQSGAALRVVTVGVDRNHSRDLSNVVDAGTRASGGRYDNVMSSRGLTSTLTSLATELTHQYLVTYAHPESLIPPESVTVSSPRANLSIHGTLVRDSIAERR
jgi:hypothetical protein